MAKTLAELYNKRRDTNLSNRVEIAADMWALQQAERVGPTADESLAYKNLAMDILVEPQNALSRLMRMVPLAAEQAELDLDAASGDLILAGLVSQLLDTYAIQRAAIAITDAQ